MSNRADDAPYRRRDPLKSASVRVLAILLFAEAAALIVATVYLLVELLTEAPDSYASAIALTVLCASAALWLAVIGVNTLRGKSWIRGATITVQLLQIALAIGSFQGVFARADIGWMLLLPAIVVLVLLFTPAVLAATARRES